MTSDATAASPHALPMRSRLPPLGERTRELRAFCQLCRRAPAARHKECELALEQVTQRSSVTFPGHLARTGSYLPVNGHDLIRPFWPLITVVGSLYELLD